MENKYYAPTINEFYEGFEFELQTVCDFGKSKDPRGYEVTTSLVAWIDQTFILNYHNSIIKKALENNVVRVKYLDEQDIKSLGFKEDVYNGVKCFTKNNCQIFFFGDNVISIDLFSGNFRNQYFRGLVKNKSELKRLLNQLNIL